jgi:hypothetical protein
LLVPNFGIDNKKGWSLPTLPTIRLYQSPKYRIKQQPHADIDVERFVAICRVSQGCLWKLGLSFVVKINFYF